MTKPAPLVPSTNQFKSTYVVPPLWSFHLPTPTGPSLRVSAKRRLSDTPSPLPPFPCYLQWANKKPGANTSPIWPSFISHKMPMVLGRTPAESEASSRHHRIHVSKKSQRRTIAQRELQPFLQRIDDSLRISKPYTNSLGFFIPTFCHFTNFSPNPKRPPKVHRPHM